MFNIYQFPVSITKYLRQLTHFFKKGYLAHDSKGFSLNLDSPIAFSLKYSSPSQQKPKGSKPRLSQARKKRGIEALVHNHLQG